ncbi:basic proline-rich protein-like [Balaenoptera musculus]|uniref:Basic proline-rich protein-like n=1 Tax=Balaenoptera musculus TaxID=9771 RepID=A0A8B8WSJ7_BALMU|nr:basic proline-rich protein-like [Balaenoptera musculus]
MARARRRQEGGDGGRGPCASAHPSVRRPPRPPPEARPPARPGRGAAAAPPPASGRERADVRPRAPGPALGAARPPPGPDPAPRQPPEGFPRRPEPGSRPATQTPRKPRQQSKTHPTYDDFLQWVKTGRPTLEQSSPSVPTLWGLTSALRPPPPSPLPPSICVADSPLRPTQEKSY